MISRKVTFHQRLIWEILLILQMIDRKNIWFAETKLDLRFNFEKVRLKKVSGIVYGSFICFYPKCDDSTYSFQKFQ